MRLPYLQVDSEAFERAVELAALLGVSEAQAVGHLVLLWRWCLSRPQDEALEGLVGGAKAGALLEAGSRWDGQAGALVEALMEVGLVEMDAAAAAFRVRGLDRYRSTIARKETDRDRKRAVRRTSAGRPADKVGQNASELELELEPEKTTYVAPAAPSPAPETVPQRPTHIAILEAPDTPTDSWGVDEFFRWYQAERVEGVDGLPQERPPHPRRMSTWWALARGQCSVEQLQAAAHRYGSDPYWKRAVPPVPFSGFMSQWDRFVTEGVRDAG